MLNITAKRSTSARTVRLELVLTFEDLDLLATTPYEELTPLTQVILRNYGFINHRNKPTDLLRDLQATKAFQQSGVSHTYDLGRTKVSTTVNSQPTPARD